MNHISPTAQTFVIFVMALEKNGLRFFVDQKPPMVAFVLSRNKLAVLALSHDDPVSLFWNDLINSLHIVLRVYFLDPLEKFIICTCPRNDGIVSPKVVKFIPVGENGKAFEHTC